MPLSYKGESLRLQLEPLSKDTHLEDFHQIWTDPEAVKWTTRITKKSIQETADWLVTILPSDEQPDIDKWAILIKDEFSDGDYQARLQDVSGETRHDAGFTSATSKKHKCIGVVGNNRWSDQGMETGYAFNKDYWGKGYATEAFACFLDMFWKIPERRTIPHLVAKVYPDNLQSIKVLKKCGGRQGKVLRSVELRGGAGERGDLHCWYFDRPDIESTVNDG